MDILEKKQHYIVLFDCYENLLTDKQRQYFKDYYFEDMSLSEISQEYGVSRNAVFDQLNKIYNSLEQYEEKLGLFEKYKKGDQFASDDIVKGNLNIIVGDGGVGKSSYIAWLLSSISKGAKIPFTNNNFVVGNCILQNAEDDYFKLNELYIKHYDLFLSSQAGRR